MELRRFIAIARRRAIALVIAVLAGALGGYLGASHTAKYQAQAFLYVGRPISANAKPNDDYGPIALAQILAVAVATPQVSTVAIRDEHLAIPPGTLAQATTAAPVPNASLIVVSVASSNPLISETLTNAMAKAFTEVAATLPPVLSAAGVGASSASTDKTFVPQIVSLYRTALLPTATASTESGRDVGLGAIAGLLIAAAVVGLVDLTGLAARTTTQIEAQLGLRVVGVVPFEPGLADTGKSLTDATKGQHETRHDGG